MPKNLHLLPSTHLIFLGLYSIHLMHCTFYDYRLEKETSTLPHSTTLYPGSTRLYYILSWLHLTLHDSTIFYHGSTWLYLTLIEYTMALHDSTALYYGST